VNKRFALYSQRHVESVNERHPRVLVCAKAPHIVFAINGPQLADASRACTQVEESSNACQFNPATSVRTRHFEVSSPPAVLNTVHAPL